MNRRKLLVMACALLVLAGLGVWGSGALAAAPSAALSSPGMSIPGQQEQPQQPFDCSQIEALGIDKQMNQTAGRIMVECGRLKPAGPAQGATADQSAQKLLRPLLGGPDVNTITSADTHPQTVQSESWVWGHGNTVVVTYNDSRRNPAGIICGASYSTDGGVTFTRITPSPFTGLGSCSGDPYHFYSVRAGKWFAHFFAGSCANAIGQWESTDGITWTSSGCVINSGSQDRFSGWVDNNPASPYYGRQYTSSNNFSLGGGAIVATYSSDDGLTWAAPVTVFSSFRRNVQMTGSLGTDGTVFIQGMDEGGGGLNGPRQNYIYRSTNGGATWTQIQQNASTFLGPGRGTCGYFAGMYNTPVSGYYRHMGWGEPGVGPNQVVHYAYAERPASGGDVGNIMYIRSSDNGSTWSTPIRLDQDAGTAAQFMPSLSVSANGGVVVTWYDERDGGQCTTTPGNCYRRYGRQSNNNGLTWNNDEPVSDAFSPLPVHRDPGIQPCYAGDYDYASANQVTGHHYTTWTDGRVIINGEGNQDVWFDRMMGVGGTPTSTPTGTLPTATRTNTPTNTPTATATTDPCTLQNYVVATGTGTVVPGTVNTGSACDDCVTSITLPFPFQLYDQTFTAAGADSNGKLHFPTGASVFSNTCLPGASMTYTIFPFWDDLRTDGTGCTGGCGIFTSVTGSAPNRIFNIEWRTTYFSGTGTANFEVRLYEGQTRFDIVLGAISITTGATGGVQRNSTSFTQIFCNTTPANTLYTFTLPTCNTPTTGPSATRTSTSGPGTATPTVCVGGTPGPWATAAPYPLANVRYGFAQTSTHFYVFGGVAGGTRVNTVHRYDIGAGTWSAPLAPMPFASEGPTCALMASTGIVYCAEGDTGTGFASYNTSTNVWTTLPAVPGTANRYGAASGAAGGKVFIIGGEFPGTTNVQVYDVTSNTWSAGTAAPSPYILGGYQQVGNFVYVIGSYTSAPLGAEASSVLSRDKAADLDAPQANSTVSMRLDMTTAPGVWTTGPVWTPARADFGLAYDPGTNKLYAMGGDSTGGSYFNSTNLVDELSVAAWPAGTWVASPPVLTSPNRQANQAGFYGAGSIWSVGGIDGATFTFLNQVLRRSNGGPCPTSTVPAGTATATPCVGGGTATPIVVQGAITTGDPTQTNRLFRDGIPDTCAAPGTCGTPLTGTFHYDTYTYTNTSGSTVCVTVDVNTACTGTNFIYIGSYLTSFDPANICTNFLASIGSSPNPTGTFSFNVPANTVFIVNVHEVTANAGCPNYTLTITGLTGGGPCPTNTVAVPTVTRTNTVSVPPTNTSVVATPTCVVGGSGSWSAGANHPTAHVRAVGVYYPDNGRYYAMGGRQSDAAGSDIRNPREYNITTNTWVTKAAVYPDGNTNNAAGGVLSVGGANRIIVVGGSAGGATTSTGRVVLYDPVADVMTEVTTDPWPPGAANVLPGGFSVANNKFYILGGFEINVGMTADIWEYDPARAAGARWVEKTANLPVARGYIPATTIGNMIYTGGGSDFDGTVLDTADSFAYNPTADTIATIASIPRATGETRAVTVGGNMWVLGGGREAPNPSNQVNVYNPGTNSWSLGPSFVTARRNFMAASDGTNIVISGGYAPTTASDLTEVFRVTGIPCTPTVGATNTTVPATNTAIASATRTNTVAVPPTNTVRPTNTPVSCTIQFTDVPPGTFYDEVRCLACRDIIDGYACGGTNPETGQPEPCNAQNWAYFRPNNRVIRGQIAKMVSNSSADFSAPGPQRYADVPTSATFFAFINRLTNRGVMGGYPCGGINPQGGGAEPCNAQNQPYFRPYNYATRGQIAQITARGANITDPVPAGTQSFTDVPINSTFYLPVERLRARGVMTGFPCGGVNPQTGAPEPCDAQNRAYFRVNNNATRGQTAQIVSRTFFPGCVTPFAPIQQQSNEVSQ